RKKNGDAQVADGVSHGGADADRSVVHNEICKAEHNLSEGFGEAEDWLLQVLANAGESYGEKDGEDGDLQNLIFRYGFDDVFRKDVKYEVSPVKGSGIGRGLLRGCG